MQNTPRKIYNRRKVYTFLSNMYKIFNDNPGLFKVQKIRVFQGECDEYEDVILLDYRKEFISTIIHEVLHYMHPNWSECQVYREETRVMNSLSICQIRHILQRFVKCI